MRNPALPVALLGVLAACGDGPTGAPVPPEPAGTPGISLLAGTNLTDTIEARPLQAMRVRVIGENGRPAAGVIVRVDPPALPTQPWGSPPEVLAARLNEDAFRATVIDTTGADGIVHFQIRLGERAGAGRLVVTAPALGMRDTARFTMLPGAPVSVQSFPADTILTIGSTAPIQAGVYDRRGNLRPDPVALTASGDGATLAGSTVTATGFGRLSVVASAQGRADTSYVTIVPQGTLAAYSPVVNSGQAVTLYTFNLDGTELAPVRQTVVGAGYFGEMPVAWLTSTKLVYHDNAWDHTRQLYIHDLTTGTRQRFLPVGDRLAQERFPRLGHARDWVYFSGGTTFWQRELYRARPDGSGLERISLPDVTVADMGAAPSPDETELAILGNQGFGTGNLAVMDLGTQEVRSLGVTATAVKWSPDGTTIAFVAQAGGDLHLIAPDGTQTRSLGSTAYNGDIDWSPDGRYIVGAVAGGRIAVVEVDTGRELVLRYPGLDRGLASPVWRP